MQLYLSRKKCYSENNTDTKAERGAKSIRRKKGGNKMEFVFEHATMIAVIAVLFMSLNQFLGSIYSATKHTRNSFWTALAACIVNLIMNYFLIPEWGIQGAAIATLLSYYICFWLRIVDARYYVPFSFNGGKSLLNTLALVIMSWLTISAPKFYILWELLIVTFVMLLNYEAVMATVRKLLKRS